MLDVDDLSELVIRDIPDVLVPDKHPVRCIREVDLAAVSTQLIQTGVIAGFRCCKDTIDFVLQIPVPRSFPAALQ